MYPEVNPLAFMQQVVTVIREGYANLQQKYEHRTLNNLNQGEQQGWYEDGKPTYNLNYDTGDRHGLQKSYCCTNCYNNRFGPREEYYYQGLPCTKQEYDFTTRWDSYVVPAFVCGIIGPTGCAGVMGYIGYGCNREGFYPDNHKARFIYPLIDKGMIDKATKLITYLDDLKCCKDGMDLALYCAEKGRFELFSMIMKNGKYDKSYVNNNFKKLFDSNRFEYTDVMLETKAADIKYHSFGYLMLQDVDDKIQYLISKGYGFYNFFINADSIEQVQRLENMGFTLDFSDIQMVRIFIQKNAIVIDYLYKKYLVDSKVYIDTLNKLIEEIEAEDEYYSEDDDDYYDTHKTERIDKIKKIITFLNTDLMLCV